MKLLPILFLSYAAAATASWTKNLNYRSPFKHHPFMGIAIHKVVRRNGHKKPFDPTHGVAFGDPYPNSVILAC
jgi:alkaline phosphatase D